MTNAAEETEGGVRSVVEGAKVPKFVKQEAVRLAVIVTPCGCSVKDS